MPVHSHKFIETYKGLVGFGFNRETDENTVKYYLQKFSDDQVMQSMTKRLTDEELNELFSLISRLLRNHLTESEYHRLFLKDDHP
jgi:TorA maturation chaperone TorD